MASDVDNTDPTQVQIRDPYLNVTDGEQAIRFYSRAFGASLDARFPRPGGKLGHAEMRMNILVYVEDVHALVERAVAAGATVIRPVEEQFHGDLMASLEDPFGYSWFFATHVEDVSPGELERRSAEYEPEA